MSRTTTYSLRPLDKREWKGTLEGAFRVHLNRQDMNSLDLQAGDFCMLSCSATGNSGLAIAWPSADPKLSQRIVRVSDALRDAYRLSLEDRVQIEKSADKRIRATTVHISPVDNTGLLEGFRSTQSLMFAVSFGLASIETLSESLNLEVQPKGGLAKRKPARVFKIDRIEPQTSASELYVFDEGTSVVFPDGDSAISRVDKISSDATEVISVEVNTEGIGGLEHQVKILNEQLSAVLNPGRTFRFRMPNKIHRSRGIILHGPEGTGKTLLLERFADASWKKVHWVDDGILGAKSTESCKALERIFTDARASQPSLIALDGYEELFGNAEDENSTSRPVRTLISEMKKTMGSDVVVIATAINLRSLPKRLRAADTFRTSLELPMPDAKTRTKILNAVLQSQKHETLYTQIGERTHGFTGRDLVELCTVALEHTQHRLEKSIAETGRLAPASEDSCEQNGEKNAESSESGAEYDVDLVDHMSVTDFDEAKLIVRPTPMKEVFLETPKITWDDIGGAENVKDALRKVTVYPFKYPRAMSAIGMSPQKGILLYGPPGCSKTLIAQAVANQGGLNFLAVKGAELLNMYVGESERAIREVFRKARAASPSVVFFDEVDSIGRSDRGSGHTSGLNVVTTLLNEMDGIESLSNVLVLAATNAPEVLDPALMRPGRMDTILYVGPPNLTARREILNIKAKGRPMENDVDFESLAVKTDGYSGAEVVRIFDVAVENAFDEWERGSQEEMPKICQRHFDFALGKVVRQITPSMKLRFEMWQPGGVTKLL